MVEPLVQLAAVGVVGMGAQWLGWRLKLPSILLLLLSGFLLGPVLGIIHPDALLGEALFPFVSLSVGIILFEGGLTLKLKELPASGPVIFRLISLGAVVTWVIATLGARYIMQFDWPIAVLTGAILIVTGPTVVGPLLRQIRPKGRAGTILKWEGILIDPVGAVLAVLVFEWIRLGGESVTGFVLVGMLRSLVVGVVLGLLGAGILVVLLRRYWIPDHLQNGITLLLVIGLFALSDHLAAEGGLLTVIIMGIALANQSQVPIRHILEFKENLQVLLLGILFILLAGRVNINSLSLVLGPALLFVVVLIFVARPLSVLVSTWRSGLTGRERLFLMWMAPRGIVAAAVASIFAFQLEAMGFAEAGSLAATIFLVIVGTVTFYGLTAGIVARRLGLAEAEPQGVLIIGAHPFARALAEELKESNLRVLLLDSNYGNVAASRLLGLDAHYGDALSEKTLSELELGGIGRVLALTSNDDVNSLAAVHFPELFGRSQMYQLPPLSRDTQATPSHLRGRYLFDPEVTYSFLESQLERGAEVKATTLTPAFTYSHYLEHYGERTIPLALVSEGLKLTLYTADNRPTPKPGQTLISLITAEDADDKG